MKSTRVTEDADGSNSRPQRVYSASRPYLSFPTHLHVSLLSCFVYHAMWSAFMTSRLMKNLKIRTLAILTQFCAQA